MKNLDHYILIVAVISIVCTSLKLESMRDIFFHSIKLFAVFTFVIVAVSVGFQLLLFFL